MKKILMGPETPHLPEEIITEILNRLPVKSLIRFQRVCKHWKNLIDSPSFITDHLYLSTHQNPSLLLDQNTGCEPLRPLCLIDREMLVREFQNTPLIGSSWSDVRIIGFSHGLLFVAIMDKQDISTPSFCLSQSLLLWNPSIGEVRQIPKTRTSELLDLVWDYAGFGFSEIVNDYKIVKTYADDNRVIIGAEVYALSTGSWKEIELGSLLEGVSLIGDTVTANGFIFWDGEKRGDEEGDDDIALIVSFDIAMEVFTLIPWPPLPDNFILDEDNYSFELSVYEDKFAILSLSRFGDFPNYLYSLIDLWVLEEGGVGSPTERWSWTKKYTSNPCPSTLDFPGTIWRNEIVCSYFGKSILTNESGRETKDDEEKVGLYLINIITNECKMFDIPGCRFRKIVNYVENLVSVSNPTLKNIDPKD